MRSYLGGFGSYLHQANPDRRQAQTQAMDGVYRSQDKGTITEFRLAPSQAALGSDSQLIEGIRVGGKESLFRWPSLRDLPQAPRASVASFRGARKRLKA